MPAIINGISPLATSFVGTRVAYDLALGVVNQIWSVPPGSFLPPGFSLEGNTGILSGVPTIADQYNFGIRATLISDRSFVEQKFALEIKVAAAGTDVTIVNALIAAAFQNGRILAGMKWWVEDNGLNGAGSEIALRYDDGGLHRTVARIGGFR
jgi:hypothetical protein